MPQIENKFYYPNFTGEYISYSIAESINSHIKELKTSEPIFIYQYLEELGINKCMELIDPQNQEYTNFYNEYNSKLLKKLKNFHLKLL